MSLQDYKSRVIAFFNDRNYHRDDNTADQEVVFNILRKNNIKYSIDSDARNYTHYVGAIIDLSPSGNVLDRSKRLDDNEYERNIINQFGSIYTMFISVSDIGPFARVFWNKWYINNDNPEVKYIDDTQIPVQVSEKADELILLLKKNVKLEFFNLQTLKEKLNWLEETDKFSHIEYVPTFEELLFGGLDLYNELDI